MAAPATTFTPCTGYGAHHVTLIHKGVCTCAHVHSNIDVHELPDALRAQGCTYGRTHVVVIRTGLCTYAHVHVTIDVHAYALVHARAHHILHEREVSAFLVCVTYFVRVHTRGAGGGPARRRACPTAHCRGGEGVCMCVYVCLVVCAYVCMCMLDRSLPTYTSLTYTCTAHGTHTRRSACWPRRVHICIRM